MNTKRAKAMIEIGANPRGLDRGLADAKKKMRGFGASVKKLGAGSLGIGKTLLGGMGAGVGMSMAGGVVDMFAKAGGEVANYEMQLTRFQVATSKTGEEMGRLRAEIDRVSSSTAMSREQILSGAASYVAITGDANGATAAMESFARIAQASGSQVSDVATAAAALKDNLKLDAGDFEKAFGSLIAQGKAGAVEVKDLAAELASLAPQFANFQTMGGLEGVGELGAAFQVVRKGFGNANEAGTGLKSMMTSLVAHADRFEKAGVKIFNKDPRTGAKTMRKFSDIWGDINNSKLVKDPTALGKAFGRDEARRAYEMFFKHKQLYGELITAGQDYGTVTRDLGTVMASPAGKLTQTFNDMKIALAEAFTPERIEKFANIMERVAKAAGWIVDKLDNVANFIDGVSGGFEMGDDTGAIGRALGYKKSDTIISDESKKYSAKMLPWVMGELKGKGAGDYDEMAGYLRKRAGTMRQSAQGSILGQFDPAAIEAVALENMAKFVSAQREGMRSAFGQLAAQLAKAPAVNVKMDASTVAKTVDNAAVHRNPRGR